MGHFVDGAWHPGFYKSDDKGHFVRPATTFRDRLDRERLDDLHLYVSYACPWAHRTLIARGMLDYRFSFSTVDWLLTDDGWSFSAENPDPINGCRYLREVYLKADSHYTGRVTTPVLWDRREGRIVNNESREILRQLWELKRPLATGVDEAIDSLYDSLNNGVYRCGFASAQGAYDEAVEKVFARLDELEDQLGEQPWLCGAEVSEADVCLFTTLYRFDPVYSIHFKCSRRRIMDYPNLSRFLRDFERLPGVAETCRLDHIRNHYYQSHRHINPFGIVAVSPAPR